MAFIGAAAQAVATQYVADMNYKAQKETNKTNLQIATETNQANRELAEQENAWNVEQWHRNNEYNNPSAQADRLQNLGLSKQAIAQSVANVPSQPIQSANLANQVAPSPLEAPQMDLGAVSGLNIVSIARQVAALKKESAEASQAETSAKYAPDVILTDLDAKKASIDTMMQDFQQKALAFPHSLMAIKYQNEHFKQDLAYNKEYYNLNLQEKQKNIQLLEQKFDFLGKMNDMELAKMDGEIKNLEKTGRNIDSSTQLNQANADLANTQENLVKAQQQNVEEQTETQKAITKDKQLQNILTRFGCPESTAQRIGAMVATGQLSTADLLKSLYNIKSYMRTHRDALLNDPLTRNLYRGIIDEGGLNMQNASSQLGKLGNEGAHAITDGFHASAN